MLTKAWVFVIHCRTPRILYAYHAFNDNINREWILAKFHTATQTQNRTHNSQSYEYVYGRILEKSQPPRNLHFLFLAAYRFQDRPLPLAKIVKNGYGTMASPQNEGSGNSVCIMVSINRADLARDECLAPRRASSSSGWALERDVRNGVRTLSEI